MVSNVSAFSGFIWLQFHEIKIEKRVFSVSWSRESAPQTNEW